MKILIAIKTCHRYRDRADAQRATWVPRVAAAVPPDWTVDVRFFLGRAPCRPERATADSSSRKSATQNDNAREGSAVPPDTCLLDCDDSYNGLVDKTRGMFQWALSEGYDFCWSTDDDTYAVPERLLASGFEAHDYIGRLRGPSGGFPAPYASGFAVWTSRRAMEVLAAAPVKGHQFQDRWIGNVLYGHGFRCHRDPRYALVLSRRNMPCARDGCRQDNDIIAACEFWPDDMRREHAAFLNGAHSTPGTQHPTPDSRFSRVAVIIKTFLRDGLLIRAVRDIEKHLPGMKLVIVDDGYESRLKIALYQELARRGHVCEWMTFDSGFGAKSNRAVERIGDREYTLIGCDDFDFGGPGVADGILKMISVLDHDLEVGSVGGRVNNKPYEGFCRRGPDFVEEELLDPATCQYLTTADGVKYALCDLTVNYNLVRTKLLGKGRIEWNEQFKIGGDHYGFYHQMAEMGMKVAWCPGVNINEQRNIPANAVHAHYGRYRGRAQQATPSFLRRHGLKYFKGFYGNIDRLAEPQPAHRPPTPSPDPAGVAG